MDPMMIPVLVLLACEVEMTAGTIVEEEVGTDEEVRYVDVV